MMKQILTIIALLTAVVGCRPPRQADASPQRSEVVQRLLADARSVIVVSEGKPRLITNQTGKVMIGHPMQTVGAVTSPQEIAALTTALSETGMHGSAGSCFCGVLPYQIFLNAAGEPLVGAHVNARHQNVILVSNLWLFDGQLYATAPTGEWVEAESPLPSGYNPKYGQLALSLVKRIWPDECVRRDLPGCEDLINAHNKAEAERKEKERGENLLKLSESLGGGTTR